MALSGGQRLGPYEVYAQIGAGGMGKVYEARDTALPTSARSESLQTRCQELKTRK